MHYIVILAYLPFLAAGNLPIPAAGNEYCSESSVCPAITANVQAIVVSRIPCILDFNSIAVIFGHFCE